MIGWSSTPATAIARRAISDLLHETEPGAYGPHFEHPNSLSERDDADPLAATHASRQLVLAMQRQVVEHALRARGSGESWEDVAAALNVHNDGQPDCAAAYLTVLGVRADDPWWSPARGVVWTCSTCEEAVRDYGPDCGGPDDRESGHAITCSRHAADMLAWEALWS
jgi:hypothetical protein